VSWVLEELRAGTGPELDASRVQLWPEHFDLAADDQRAAALDFYRTRLEALTG